MGKNLKGKHHCDADALMLRAGLRAGELVGLSRDRTDQAQRKLPVNKTLECRAGTVRMISASANRVRKPGSAAFAYTRCLAPALAVPLRAGCSRRSCNPCWDTLA